MLRYLALCLAIIVMGSCRPRVFPPKPQGYFRIDTPATHTYKVFDRPDFPYSFEYPALGTVQEDTVFLNNKERNRYWININLPSLGGVINLTYKPIDKEHTLFNLENDAWGLSFFHHEKADYMNSEGFRNEHGVTGMLYTVGGNSASRYQFTATDSAKNFLRGALYFDVTPNADSLKPATDFLVQDIQHMLLTFKWKTPEAAKN